MDADRQLRISAQVAAEKYCESSYSSETITFGDGASMSIASDNSAEDSKYFASGKVSYENNSRKKFVLNDLSFSGQIRKNTGSIDGGKNNGTELYELPSFKVANDLGITFRTRSTRAMTLESKTKFVRNNHSGHYMTDAFDARQQFEQNEFISENRFSYGLTALGIRFSFSGGVDLEHQGINSTLSGIDDENIKSRATVGLFSISPNVTADLQFFIGKTDIRTSLPAKLSIVSGKGLSGTIIYPSFNPTITIRRTFSPSFEANAHVSFNVNKSDIESLLPCAVMSNYRSISYADSLTSRRSLRSNLSLKYSDNISMFYASLTGFVYLSRSDRTASSQYSDLVTITGYNALEAKRDNYGASGSISKYFGAKTFVIEIKGGWERSDNDQYLQSLRRSYRTDSFNAAVNFRLNPATWLAMDADAEWRNAKISGSASSTNTAITVSGTISLTPLKPLCIMASADYRYESLPNMSISNIPLIKVSASWKFKRMSLVAECRNLLGCSEFSRKYVNEFQTISTTTNLKGRQFLLGIKMSL